MLAYLWKAWTDKRLNAIEFTLQCFLVFCIGVCLTYTSIPYEAVGNSFIASRDGSTPYLLSLLSWAGPLKPLIDTVLSSARWFTIAIFVVSTGFQVASWLYVKSVNSAELKRFLIAAAVIFYAFEMVLAYNEYPFILGKNGAFSLKELIAIYTNYQDFSTSLDAFSFSLPAFFHCLLSVLLLDVMLGFMISNTTIKPAQSKRKKGRGQRRSKKATPQYDGIPDDFDFGFNGDQL